MNEYKIRLTEKEDYRVTEEITREAFWNLHSPGCDEHYLLHKMRTSNDYVSDLDYVITKQDKIIGNIVYTKSKIISVDNEEVETMTFGPIAVHPEFQRQGAGSLLINHTVNILLQREVPAIIVFGFPRDYVKHGFVNGCRYNIGIDFGRYHSSLLVKTLNDSIPQNKAWKYIESDAYEIDMNGFDEFDQSFPHKKKGWSPTQEEFWISSHSFIEKEKSD